MPAADPWHYYTGIQAATNVAHPEWKLIAWLGYSNSFHFYRSNPPTAEFYRAYNALKYQPKQ